MKDKSTSTYTPFTSARSETSKVDTHDQTSRAERPLNPYEKREAQNRATAALPSATTDTWQNGDETESRGSSQHSRAYDKRKEEDMATAALPHVSFEEFTELSAAGKATPEQARSCIYNLRKDLKSFPLPPGQKESAVQHAGGKVLHWLWNQPMSVRDELSLSRPFVESLCYFLVAEGRDEYVLEWLKLELADEKRHADDPGRHLWLAGLMVAQQDKTDSVILPLTTLRKALMEFRGRRLQCITFAATIAVRKMLRVEGLPSYPVELFDSFLKVQRHCGSQRVTIWHEARMLLYHPTQPDAQLLYQLLQDQTVEAWKGSEATQNEFGQCLLRGAYILRLQGRSQDAAWLEALLETKRPKLWHFRKRSYEKLDLDPKLDGLRRGSAGIPKT